MLEVHKTEWGKLEEIKTKISLQGRELQRKIGVVSTRSGDFQRLITPCCYTIVNRAENVGIIKTYEVVR
jgi:hypothetical protein